MTSTELTIVVTVPPDAAELVADRMWQWGVRAVSETDVGGDLVEIATSVGNSDDAIERALGDLDPTWTVAVREVDGHVAQVDPEFLSPTWYAPGMVSVPASIHPVRFDTEPIVTTVIDQGSAFGLGDHPTTSSSMAMLANHVERLGVENVRRVLDVGCGTGALAVLAAQLGAATVRAIDISDAAVEATLRNAALNDVAGRIDVDTAPLADVDGTYDLVLANILAPALISLAPDLRRVVADGGALVISGVLADRHDHVLDALRPLQPVRTIELDGWATVALR